MQLLPQSIDLQDWSSTQIIITGAAAGILTGLVLCYVVAYFVPSDIEDPGLWYH